MNTDLRTAPLRILVVEDVANVREELVDYLREELPGAHIEEAADVTVGLRLLHEAAERESPYDFAVLDLKLPQEIGKSAAEPDTSLAEAIVRSFGTTRTRIIQCTGHADDDAIARLKADATLKKLNLSYTVVSKEDTSFPTKVIEIIDRHLPDVVIGTRLDHPYLSAPTRGIHYTRHAPGYAPPFSIPGLVQATVDHWNQLSEDRRKTALRVFHGTEWELEEIKPTGVQLKADRSRRLLLEAKENAEALREFARRTRKP